MYMNKGIALKIFAVIAAFVAVAAIIVFILTQGDKNAGSNLPSRPERVYTEAEKTQILQDLSGVKAAAATTTTVKEAAVTVKATNDPLPSRETQKRVQTLQQLTPTVDTSSTAGPSEADKLRILNSLGGSTQ